MPSFPLVDWQRVENAGGLTASSNGTQLTANAGSNTKGNYVQLIASTAFAAQRVMVTLDSPGQVGRDFLIDIAIGAAASEQVIIPNIFISSGANAIFGGAVFIFPVTIPAGSRIAARVQASTGSNTIRISVELFGGGFAQGEQLAIVDAYGVNVADSGGTSVDPGGSGNTKGAYSQITASTTRLHRYLVLGIGTQLNVALTTAVWLVDIAVGGAGSEQVIIPNLVVQANTITDHITPQSYFLPITIPSGTRLAIRSQCSITDATDRLLDFTLHGVG
jgi:hypothetical protein